MLEKRLRKRAGIASGPAAPAEELLTEVRAEGAFDSVFVMPRSPARAGSESGPAEAEDASGSTLLFRRE